MISIKQEIQFIFSKDAPIQKKSNFLSICLTFIFWILLFLLIAFLPSSFQKKQKYETVKIVLSESQKKIIEPVEKNPQPKVEDKIIEEKVQSVVEKKQTEVEKQSVLEEKQVEEKRVEPKIEKSNQNVKTEVQEQKSKEIEYALDPMEAFALQTSKQSEQEFDWSKFDENSTLTKSQNENYVLSGNKIEGVAGEISSSSSNKISSQIEKKNFTNEGTSSITESALEKIANTSFVENSSSKITTKSNVNSSTSDDGKIQIKTTDERFRVLLEPEKPILNISDENAPDGSRTVTIIFKIQPNGYILKSDVSITPAAILSDSLREELIFQISTWRFESTNFSSTASFEFNIIRK